MKIKFHHSICLLFFLVLTSSLVSNPSESYTPKDPYVGDIVEYIWSGEETLADFPKEEIFSEDKPGLPIGKVIAWENREKGILLKIRFYEPGDHTIPVIWNSSKGLVYSNVTIKVRSNLIGNEEDLEDIESPEVFSKYLFYKIVIYALLIGGGIYIAFILFLAYRNRSPIVDAIWEKEEKPKLSFQKMIRLQNYLKSGTIYEKELAFLFTSFTKSILSEKFSQDLEQKTDADFLSFAYERTHVSMEEIRELRILFQKAKYTDSTSQLSREEALALILTWDKKLKLGVDYGN